MLLPAPRAPARLGGRTATGSTPGRGFLRRGGGAATACWRSRVSASSTRLRISSTDRGSAARGPDRGDLELDAVGRLPHGGVGVEERAQHVEKIVERGRLGECPQLVGLGVRHVGELRGRRRLEHERPPQQLDDVAREGAQILAVARGPVDGLQRRRGLVRQAPARRRGPRPARWCPAARRWSRPPVARCRRRSPCPGASARRAASPRRRAHDGRQRRCLERDLLLVEDARASTTSGRVLSDGSRSAARGRESWPVARGGRWWPAP